MTTYLQIMEEDILNSAVEATETYSKTSEINKQVSIIEDSKVQRRICYE